MSNFGNPLWVMVCTVAWRAARRSAGTAAAAYCKDGAAQEAIPPPKIYRSVNCDAQRALSVPSSSYVPSPHSSNGRIKFKVSSPPPPSLSVREAESGGSGVFWAVEQVNFEFALG